MIRCSFITIAMTITIVLFGVAQFGCVASMRGGAGATTRPASTKSADPICYTRAEHARIAVWKVRCKNKVKELRGELVHQQAKAKLLCEEKTKKLTVRLQTCLQQAKVKHTCPSCLQPVLVAGGIGFVAGVVITVVTVAVIELNKPGGKP